MVKNDWESEEGQGSRGRWMNVYPDSTPTSRDLDMTHDGVKICIDNIISPSKFDSPNLSTQVKSTHKLSPPPHESTSSAFIHLIFFF